MTRQIPVLVVVTGHAQLPNGHKTGLWLEEYAVPAELFRQQGFSVTVASLTGGATPVDPNSLPKNVDELQILNELASTQRLKDLQLTEYEAVFFPGGHGVMFDLAESAETGAIIADFLTRGRVVGAVCHGPAALVAAKYPDGTPVVKGKKLSCFTDNEERAAKLDELMPFLLQSRLEQLGAEVITVDNWQDHHIVDGLLVTGQNPQSSTSTAMAFIDAVRQNSA